MTRPVWILLAIVVLTAALTTLLAASATNAHTHAAANSP